MPYSRIVGTGAYVPEKIMTNHELATVVNTNHEWIFERTGITSRHLAGTEDTVVNMAEKAARQAIATAGLLPDEVDLVIVATTTPDCVFPSTACLLQTSLGMQHHCPAFDISAACSGFIYGLSVADQYIKTGFAKNILFVGTEIMSRLLNWQDRSTCVLFGDGAGAVVLQASDKPGIFSTHLHADGRHKEILCAPSFASGNHYIQMQGKEVFRLAVNRLSELIDETLQTNGLPYSAIDWLIPHQANARIIQAIAKKMSLPMEKVILTIQHHSNTSAASIPLALHQGISDGRIKRGDTLLLEAFGAGLSWGSALVAF